jgi:hypothetical protein
VVQASGGRLQFTGRFLQFVELRWAAVLSIPTVRSIDNPLPPEITMTPTRSLFSRTETAVVLSSLIAIGGLMMAGVSDMTARFDPTPPTVMVQLEPVVITGTAKAQPVVREAQQPVITKLAVAGVTTLN